MQRILLAILITAAILALWRVLTLPVYALRATRGLLGNRWARCDQPSYRFMGCKCG